MGKAMDTLEAGMGVVCMGLMWAPMGGHGTLWTLRVQCDVWRSHGVGMGLYGYPGRIV